MIEVGGRDKKEEWKNAKIMCSTEEELIAVIKEWISMDLDLIMANKAFDLSKFRKTLTKSIDGLGVGFNDPTDWISTGNYALNYLISSDFNKGVPLGKVTVLAGESGAGKSYICSGNLIKAAQEQGIYVVLVDSENALDEAWLHALGVDTSEEKLLKAQHGYD
jgi:hypothetical protein